MDTNFDMQKHGHILEQSTNYRSFNPKKRNFQTAKMQKGGLDSALFSSPGYNSIGDPYVDPRGQKLRSESLHTRKNMHGREFRPGGKFKKKMSADFLNTPNTNPAPVSANRTWGPRGFFTSPNKKGIGPGSLLQRQNYPHMVDEYERKTDQARDEKKISRDQDIGKGFRNTVRGNDTFGNNLNEYGEEGLKFKEKKQSVYKGMQHPNAWKYNSESRHAKKTINPMPEYIAAKDNNDGWDKLRGSRYVLPWYPTYKRKSEPSDTIAHNFMNRPKHNFM